MGYGLHPKVSARLSAITTPAHFCDHRHFLAKELKARMAERREQRIAAGLESDKEVIVIPWWKQAILSALSRKSSRSDDQISADDDSSTKESKRAGGTRLRTDMIRRMDDAPKLVTPSGFLSEGRMTTVPENPQAERDPSKLAPPPSPARQLVFAERPMLELPEAVETSDEEDEEDSLDEEIEERFRSRPTIRSRYVMSPLNTTSIDIFAVVAYRIREHPTVVSENHRLSFRLGLTSNIQPQICL